jgi:hypothetical protein
MNATGVNIVANGGRDTSQGNISTKQADELKASERYGPENGHLATHSSFDDYILVVLCSLSGKLLARTPAIGTSRSLGQELQAVVIVRRSELGFPIDGLATGVSLVIVELA